MKRAWLLLGIWLLVALPVGAQSLNPEQEARAYALGQRLACPQCDGQVINASEAEVAQAMRAHVRRAVADGQSDAEILEFFEVRYGEGVVMRTGTEGLLRWAPWLISLVTIGGVGVWLWRRERALGREGEEGDAAS